LERTGRSGGKSGENRHTKKRNRKTKKSGCASEDSWKKRGGNEIGRIAKESEYDQVKEKTGKNERAYQKKVRDSWGGGPKSGRGGTRNKELGQKIVNGGTQGGGTQKGVD